MRGRALLVSAAVLLGLVGAGRVFAVRTRARLALAHHSTARTTAFCSTVSVGDDLGETVERAQPGSSILGFSEGANPLRSRALNRAGRSEKQQFSVLFERHPGTTWPRYTIWTGPGYQRLYCSLEISSDARVKAVHLGPLADPSQTIGFFEDWLGPLAVVLDAWRI